MAKRILAIGDIHGCSAALDALLGAVGPCPDETLVFLGDYVDRGPDSKGVVQRLMDMPPRDNLIFLRGNHELFLLRSLKSFEWAQNWLRVGGMDTLDSYGVKTTHRIPPEHLQFFEKTCRDYYETADFLFVHAGLDCGLEMEKQKEEALFWRGFHEMKPHKSGKTVICGHSGQATGLPADRSFARCLDTLAYKNLWLTCMDVASGEYWQANQTGETRNLRLE